MPEESHQKAPGIIDAENLEVKIGWEITHYNMDDEGHFTKRMEANWGAKELVNNQSWEIVKERIRDAKEKVIAGQLSPIAYYMQKCLTDIKTLALYTGLSTWKVKRHLKPRVFSRLNDKSLKRYADFFQISIDQLKDVNSLKQ